MTKLAAVFCALFPLALGPAPCQQQANAPEALEEFRDLALGMFIHWSLDAQLGSVISHSLVGASDDYKKRFFEELPKTFNPRDYRPDEWAELARVCGVKYVVPTAKHHSGFCMFPTETTPFHVGNTRYGRDIIAPLAKAVRKEGLRFGLYFSPEDFWVLDQQGHPIARRRDYCEPANNPRLMEHDSRQIAELLDRYGPVDMWFFDGGGDSTAFKRMVWEHNPRTVVTRGELQTPEQRLPEGTLPDPWEACFTLGTQWQFKPTNERYKSGTKLIEMLIQTRAKGGNLLLNVGPDPRGEIPFEQARILRELGLWLFVNGEAIYRVRPWTVPNEGDHWFTRAADANTLYVFLPADPTWKRGSRKSFVITSARLTDASTISVLGHGGQIVEYKPNTRAEPRLRQQADGIQLSVVRAQRLYNDSTWPNPVVVKITDVLAPPGK